MRKISLIIYDFDGTLVDTLFDIVNKLDQLFTYRIMHSEILIYDDILQIDEDTNIDTLATELSLIGAKSNLNGETFIYKRYALKTSFII